VSGLHVGLILPNYGALLDAEALAGAAVAAEEAGFDSGWVTDHVIVPREHAPIYGTITEALVSLGFLAGRTHRLQLGVSALIVPQRNPFVALKQLASLDFLSGGRIVTAVAAGWMEGEFRTLGADFERRGRVTNDWLELVASSFAQMPGQVVHGGGLPIEDGFLAPALVRPGGPEIWVAGLSEATLRRAARTGVWHPVALPPDELGRMASEFRRLRPGGRVVLRLGVYFAEKPERLGRDERGRHALVGPPEWLVERLIEYVEQGCDGFVLNLEHETPGLAERVARFAEEVRPALEAAEGEVAR
jgi:alkanesulfonate monooxygenase SsuD/methylene tetrahydromethanopterin reductase-like flavin-dependent oxidoreductase (luciferase family)